MHQRNARLGHLGVRRAVHGEEELACVGDREGRCRGDEGGVAADLEGRADCGAEGLFPRCEEELV